MNMWAWLVGVWAGPQHCPVVLIGEELVGGRGLWMCGRGHNTALCAHWSRGGRWAWLVGMWAWPVWVWLEMQCEGVVRCSMGVA